MAIETRQTGDPTPVSGAAAFLRWLDGNLARRLDLARREGRGADYLASLEAAAAKIVTGCARVAAGRRPAPGE
jgi:hypothetical protein